LFFVVVVTEQRRQFLRTTLRAGKKVAMGGSEQDFDDTGRNGNAVRDEMYK